MLGWLNPLLQVLDVLVDVLVDVARRPSCSSSDWHLAHVGLDLGVAVRPDAELRRAGAAAAAAGRRVARAPDSRHSQETESGRGQRIPPYLASSTLAYENPMHLTFAGVLATAPICAGSVTTSDVGAPRLPDRLPCDGRRGIATARLGRSCRSPHTFGTGSEISAWHRPTASGHPARGPPPLAGSRACRRDTGGRCRPGTPCNRSTRRPTRT